MLEPTLLPKLNYFSKTSLLTSFKQAYVDRFLLLQSNIELGMYFQCLPFMHWVKYMANSNLSGFMAHVIYYVNLIYDFRISL